MNMGRLGLTLCVLVLLAAAEAGRKKSNRQNLAEICQDNSGIPSPPGCSSVQSFECGRKYHYEYETTIESRNNNTHEAVNGKKIKCHDVMITVPSRCVGTLSIKNCTVYESTLLQNGSLVYTPAPEDTSTKMEKQLYKYKMYFYFNKGEITSVFYDGKSEPSDIMNFKRGLLSALQLKYNSTGLQKPVYESFKVPEVNIFGAGNSSVEVQSLESGLAKTVRVSRDLDSYELPWKRHQWATFRNVFEGHDLADFVSDMIIDQAENITGNSSQSCMYTLARGRTVQEVECVERKPVNLYNNTFFRLLGMNQQGNYTANTTVQLRLRQKRVKPMEHRDKLHRIELARFQKRYKEESLMFEEQWEEAMDSVASGFDAVEAINVLVTRPENRSTPALFAKLARYVTRCSKTKLQEIWQQIRNRYNGHEQEKATNIWVQLLNGCSSASYWCPLTQCEPNTACQDVLSQFIKATPQAHWTENIRNGVMKAIATMPNPNSNTIDAALDICRSNTTAENIVMLGKALARYVQDPKADLNQAVYIRAKEYLQQIFNDCTIHYKSAYEEKRIKMAAMKSIASLMEHGESALNNLVQCASTPQVPKELSLTAIRSLQELPLSDQRQRQQIVRIVENRDVPVTVRLASYLLIMTKEPSEAEIERIAQTIVREDEPHALKYYVTEHIKSQVVLRNTSFCELSPNAMENILAVIRRGSIDIGIDINSEEQTYSEKRYVTKQNITIPILNKELECEIASNLVFTQNSMVPILVNVTVSSIIGESNITLFETKLDFSKMVSVLDPLFGENGVFPKQDLEKFLNMPLSQLLRPVLRDHPLLSRNEVDRLTMIQTEGELSYSMLMLKNKSPFDFKLLGVPLSYKALLDLPLMQNINLMNMWKIVDTFEKGWDFEGVLADQPMLGHLASPSSIGWPHIFRMDAAYFVHVHSRVVIPIQKIMLTRSGEVTVRSKPTIKASVSWNQKIQMPLSLSCGSGYQLTAGHNSKLDGSVVIGQENIRINLEPLLPTTELISIRGDDVIVNNSQVKVVELPDQQCERQCIWPATECDRDAWYYKTCMRPNMDLGLYYASTSQRQFHFLIAYKTPDMASPRSNGPQRNYEIELMSFDIWPSQTAAWSLLGRLNPREKTMLVKFESQRVVTWKIEANALIQRIEENMPFEQLFASCNVTVREPIIHSLQTISVNKILVKRQQHQQPEESMYDKLGSFIGLPEVEEAQVDPNKVFYNIESDLQLYGEQRRMSAMGKMCLNKTDGGYSIQMKVKQGALIDRSNRRLCDVNVTSSRIAERGMGGFLTQVRVENMTTLFPSPLTFLNKFSRFNITSKVVNNTQNNKHHQDFVVASFIKNSPEPYYFRNSYSNVRNPQQLGQNNETFMMNTTMTINWAQLHFDIISRNVKEIESFQKLIIPSVSIPYSKVEKFHHKRISETDAHLRPTCYINKIATGIFSNATYYFKANATKLPCQQQERSLYSVDMSVSPVECPICHNVVIEMNGMRLESEYAKKPNWQGHSMFIEMHKSHMDKIPLKNKTKEVISRFTKSKDMDKLKVGYTVKSNQSDYKHFYEIGYHLGDKKLSVLTNLTLPNLITGPVICGLRMNVTCQECLILTNTSFKTGFGILYNTTIPRNFSQEASNGNSLDVAFDFQQQEGVQAGLGFYQEVYAGKKLIHFASHVNVSFTPGYSYLRFLYPEQRYVYKTGINVTQIQSGNSEVPTVYRVAYPVSFYEGSPWMIGNWTVSQQTVKQNRQLESICNPSEQCAVYTLDMAQMEKCKNFHGFYKTRDQVSPYKSVNCTYHKMSIMVSAHNTWNISFVFDGSNNPDFLPQQIRVLSLKDNNQNMVQSLNVSLARHFYPSPMQLNATYIYSARKQDSDFKFALESEEIKGSIRKNSGESMIMNVTTQHIPLDINCQGHADLSNQQKTSIRTDNCMVHHPDFTTYPLRIGANGWYKSLIDNELTFSVTNSSGKIVTAVTNMHEGMGMTRVFCGQENNKKSPCNFKWAFDGEKMTLEARVNTTMVNHTTEASLSGINNLNVLNWVANMQTSTSVVSKSKCSRCHNCTTAVTKYEFDSKLKDNKLELISTCLNSTQWPILRAPGSLYFHYISNNTADLDLFFGTDIEKRNKLEIGMYQGINEPNSKYHSRNASRSDYLEAYYFQLSQCQKNMTFISKNLFNQSQVQHRQLQKMETKARSNFWPVSCDSQWEKLFAQLFPQTPVTPFCAKDMEVCVTYDLNKNRQVKVELDREQKRVMKIVYDQSQKKHKLQAICQDEKNPTCNVTVLIGAKELSLNTSLNLTVLKHDAKMKLIIRPNNRSEETMQFYMCSNNSLMLSEQPIVLNATANYTHEKGWYILSKINSTKNFDNHIHVEQGMIKNLRLFGQSIMILSKPRSWNVSFTNTSSVYQISAHVQLDQDSKIKASYYEGQNQQNASLHEPQERVERFIEGFLWNYTSCNEKAQFKWTNVRSQRNGKFLALRSVADIDMWPFQQVRRVLYTPSYLACPLCLGELKYNVTYNTTDDLKLLTEVIFAKTSLLSMNYTIGNETQRPGYYLFGKTEFVGDILREKSPRMLLSTNTTILSGQNCTFNITVERQEYALVNFKIKEHFNYGPIDEWRQHFTLDSDLISIFLALENQRNVTVLDVKYPHDSKTPLSVKLLMRNNDFEIKNVTIRTGMSEWHVKRMVFTFVRNTSNILGGLTMHDLDLEIRTNLHYKQPDVTRVNGSASAVFGGKWYVEISDETREKFVVSWKLTPTPNTAMHSFVLMKLPFVEMNVDGNTTWSDKMLKNDYNCSMALAHPLTRKMLPMFDLFIKDNLQKNKNCLYHGKMYWEANVWNPIFSTYHINPRMSVLLNPKTQMKSEMRVNFTMGEYYIHHNMDFTDEVQKVIPIFKTISICVPREATGNSVARLPFWESTHALDIKPKKYEMTSNATVLLRLPRMYVVKPIFNCTNVMKFYLTKDDVLVGSSNCNGTVMTPKLKPYVADFTITPVTLPSGATVRKFGVAYKLNDEEPLMLNITEPKAHDRRTIQAYAFGNEILRSTLEMNTCALSSPLFSELLCIPAELQWRDINANLPTARILRQFPIFNTIIPDTELLNIVLRDSYVSLVTTKQDKDNWNIACKSRMSGPSWSRAISQELARLNLPHYDLSGDEYMNTWYMDTTITRTPSQIDCIFDSTMNTTLIEDHFRLHWIPMFTLKEIVFQIKTKGIVEEYLPLDIDWEFTNDPRTKNWTFALHTCQFRLHDQVKGKISFNADSSLKNMSASWKLGFKHKPVLNHEMGVKIGRENRTGNWTLGSFIKSELINLNTSSRFGNFSHKFVNLTISVPTLSKNLTVAFKLDQNKQHKLIITMKDQEDSRYICSSRLNSNGTVDWNCTKQQLDPRQGWQQRERYSAKQLMDVSPSGLFSLVKNVVSFKYTKTQDQKWIEKTLEKVFGLSDEGLRSRIARYIVNETHVIQKKLENLLKLSTVQSWSNWVDDLIKILPSLIPVEQYLNQTLGQLNYFTSNRFNMRVVSGNGSLALQYNITCFEQQMPDIMLQLNFTTSEGYPVCNISIVTPFSDQHLMLDLGAIAKPRMIGGRSYLSESRVQVNFTCSKPGMICATAELVLANDHHYKCEASMHINSQHRDWNVVCHKIINGRQEDEVARFTVTSPSFLKTVKTVYYLTINYLEGRLESYLDRIMNIPSHSTLSNDLTQSVTHIYDGIKMTCFLIFPDQAQQIYQLEKAAKEGVTLGIHHVKEISRGNYQVSYPHLIKSAVNYLSTVNYTHGARLPIIQFNLSFFAAKFYVELGKEGKQNVSFVFDTSVPQKPDLDQKLRADLWYAQNKAFVRCSANNTFVHLNINVCLSNMSLVNGSIGFPQSENRVNVTYIGEPNAPLKRYEIKFVDTEGSKYVCNMNQQSNTVMRTECNKQPMNQQSMRHVCQFNTPVDALNVEQLVMKAGLLVPEMYVASMKPAELKTYLRTMFQVTDEHSLEVIVDYLSNVSHDYIERLHKNLVQFFADKVTELPSLIKKNWTEVVFKTLLANPRVLDATRGSRPIGNVASDVISDMAPDVISRLMRTNKTISQTCLDVKLIAQGIFKAVNVSFEPMTRVYSVEDFVRDTLKVIKMVNKLNYVCQKVIFDPKEAKCAIEQVYEEMYIREYIMALFKLGGPITELITGHRTNTVISFKEQTYELPVVNSNSKCKYLLLTDPLLNAYNIISQGDSLLLVVPNITVEMTSDKRVFVTTDEHPRKEETLPYFSHEIYCVMTKPDRVECQTMQYKVVLKTGSDNRVRRTITVYLPKYAMGVLGVQSYEPTSVTMFLPNGTEAQNASQLMNAYKLSNRQECVVPEQRVITFNVEDSTCGPLCDRLFRSPELADVIRQEPRMKEAYVVQCKRHCQNNNKTQACDVVTEFVSKLREKKIPVEDVKECLPCSLNGPSNILEKSEVYILVSLSRERVQTDPKRTVRRLATKILNRMQMAGLSDSKVGIVTYGGNGNFSKPALTALNGISVSQHRENLLNVTSSLNFNGPDYTPVSTVKALTFLSETIKSAPSSVAKCVVVVASENDEMNCGSQNVTQLVTDFRNDMTSVFLYSSMDNNQCKKQNQHVILDTEGVCMRTPEDSEDDMSRVIVQKLAEKIRSSVSCECRTGNRLTGEMKSKCRPQEPEIQF